MSALVKHPTTLAEVGARLINNGYRIVPIRPGEKGPRGVGATGWPDFVADSKMLRSWLKRGFGSYGVGIIGAETPGIDLDISDQRVLERVLAWCEENIGVVARRTGRPPRVLLPCFCSRPLRWQSSKKYRAPDGQEHQIEILPDRHQFAAYAVHPGTGQPYRWEGDDPLTMPAELLPELTAEKVDELLRFFEDIVPVDWLPIARASGASSLEHAGNPIKTAPLAKLRSAMEFLPNDELDYKSWVRVAYALWNAVGEEKEEGFDLFDEWSAKADKYVPEITEDTWRGIKKVDAAGAGTIFHLAMDAGWRWPPPGSEFEAIDLIEEAVHKEEQRRKATEDGKRPEGASPARANAGFRAIPFHDAARSALERSAKPLVEGIFDQSACGVIYGRSNSGKTFVALDMAVAIATGRPWNARDVERGAVLYIAAEGGGGIFKRFAALQRQRTVPIDTPLHLAACPVDLFNPEADLKAVILEARRVQRESGQPLRLVVVDTLARSMGAGDENSGKDMGAYVRNVDRIRDETGAAVLIIHHTGKDAARGMRGHSSLIAAIDTEIEVERPERSTVGIVKCGKQRDLDRFDDLRFTLEGVTIGLDAKGKDVGSCVVRWLDGSEFDTVPLTTGAEKYLAALRAIGRPATYEEWDDEYRSWVDTGWRSGQEPPRGTSEQNLRKYRRECREAGHVREMPNGKFVLTAAAAEKQ